MCEQLSVGGILVSSQLLKVFLGCQGHTIPSYNTKDGATKLHEAFSSPFDHLHESFLY